MSDSPKFLFEFDEPNEKASITVEGRTYRIFYDLDAIEMFYLIFGVNPAIEGVGLQPMRLAVLLWCGLLRYEPKIESDFVKSWFTPRSMRDLAVGTFKAWSLSVPTPVKEAPKPNPRKARRARRGGGTPAASRATTSGSPSLN
jgi:hypothetical protein